MADLSIEELAEKIEAKLPADKHELAVTCANGAIVHVTRVRKPTEVSA